MRPKLEASDIFNPAFLKSAVKQVAHLFRPAGSGFYLYDAVEKRARLVATHNLREIPWETHLPEKVIQSKTIVIEKDASPAALLAAPLCWRQSVRGVLVVTACTADRCFDETDAKLLQSMADLTASVLEQAERLSRMTAQFRALHVIDVALSSSLQLDRVLKLILDKAVELVDAEHGSLRRINPDTGELELVSHLGAGWTPQALAYIPKRGIARWVAEHRQSYLCPDVRKDPHNVVLFEDMRSSVAVPFLDSQKKDAELLGVLLLESSRLAGFDQQDVELLEALAQEAVIAIQNATQHQELQLIHTRLKAEQERRVAAEKWTVMGQAATALAHRINNLMGIVPASAGEIHRTIAGIDMPDGEREWIESNLSRINRNTHFVLKLSDALFRPFKDSGPLASLDINLMLNEALESADLPSSITVQRYYDPDIPLVKSSSLMVDIFLELFTNARKAMQETESKRLDVSTRKMQDAYGTWVIVEIKDSGKGIPSKQMHHLWDMFQQSSDGLGFGLWWLRTFIERQGGTITCSSKPGKGAAFTVRLPVLAGEKGELEEII